MTIEDKIELYFFHPARSKKDYRKIYKRFLRTKYTKEKVVRFSPLYILLRDTGYCFGIGEKLNSVRNKIEPANFAGVILTAIAFNSLVKEIYYGKHYEFANKYMDISDQELVDALRYLRNGLEHSYYSLFFRLKISGREEKIYFDLGNYPDVIKKNTRWRRLYSSRMYFVNPRKLLSTFEKGIELFKQDLLNPVNVGLRRNFEKRFTVKNWIFFT